MPLRFPFAGSAASAFTRPYWGARYYRPVIHVYLVGPSGDFVRNNALLDTGSDYVLFDPAAAERLGTPGPFARTWDATDAGGHTLAITYPEDGTFSLFVTDYREFVFLPRPPVGFRTLPTSPSAVPGELPRAVLGGTGFLQYFEVKFFYRRSPPEVELVEETPFPGLSGPLPRDRALKDFIRACKAAG
jgi:hypothetical protein